MKQHNDDWDLPRVIAHRGASEEAPENTLPAMRKAKALGARWVESDVMLTSRGEAIMFHDAKLHRTTNGYGYVARTPYSVISRLDAGAWFSAEFAGTHVPTLAEWLQEAAHLKLGINLEIKSGKWQNSERMAEIIVTELARHWQQGVSMPLLSSRSEAVLSALYKRAPQLRFGLIVSRWDNAWKNRMARCHCISLHIDERDLTLKRVQLVKAEGYRVLAYTVNDVRRAATLFEWGVDAVFSDRVNLEGDLIATSRY